MCTMHKTLQTFRKWNWDGDEIVNDTKISNARCVVKTKKCYDLDIREFIAHRDNIVIKNTLRTIEEKLLPEVRNLLASRKAGSYDARVEIVKEYVSKEIRYVDTGRGFDNWLFPNETLTMKKGDCEDRAFLLASLMLATGISSYNVRVCFGKLRDAANGAAKDHVWVAYKSESGIWKIIEPMNLSFHKDNATDHHRELTKVQSRTEYEYEPRFLLNNEHLWRVRNVFQRDEVPFAEYIPGRDFFDSFNPSFGYKLHKEIVMEAIDPGEFVKKLSRDMKNGLMIFGGLYKYSDADYLGKFASMVSGVDIALDYNPLVHFDNGLIGQAFENVDRNMKSKTLKGFATAVHSLSDIYAHTSYAHFASGSDTNIFRHRENDSAEYRSQFKCEISYGAECDFDLKDFTVNDTICGETDIVAAKNFWRGKIISGRFGQRGDSRSFLETTQFCPENFPDIAMCGALPHHNEMSVDSETRNEKHVLYSDDDYGKQFRFRRSLAIEHVKEAFREWSAG